MDGAARFELGCMPLHAQVDDALAQAQLDPELAILLSRPQAQPLARHDAEQTSLRDMRALVRKLSLRTNEHDLSGKHGIPQTTRDGVPCGTAANDQRSLDSSPTRRR